LCWKAIRQPEHAQFIERAGRAFLEGYFSVQGDIDERWLWVYQAASLLKIAGRRFRSLTYLEWPLIIHLIQLAGLFLNEVLLTRSVTRRLEWDLEKKLSAQLSQ
jgi:hypothetical protein